VKATRLEAPVTLATRISIAGITLAMPMFVLAGSASAAEFSRQLAGRVGGTVLLGSGEAAAGVRVELVSADEDDTPSRGLVRSAPTDTAGRFQFEQVAPGRYFVGVDISGRHAGPLVFPATFHPGLSDRTLATIITMEGAGSQELTPMILPPPRVEFTLTGRVVHADGRPAVGASVVLARGDGNRSELAAPIEADYDGSFSLAVHEGLVYLVRAFYSSDDNPDQIRGESEPFEVTIAPVPVTVVVGPGR
jgi:5-hydroxyisourate hydrolase-like protein (transthyretin family)